MKILFMGTPDFAAASLDRLIRDGREIVGVFSQPDRPRGRGYTLTPPPVKVRALEAGIPVYQPETLKDGAVASLLASLSPDLIAVVAYGKILPRYVLDFPRFGCVNVHGSLLPKYRGAAPMQRAIMNGEKYTGITTMYMAEGLDTGDMLLRGEIPILPSDNFETIHDKMAVLGADLLAETIDGLAAGRITPVPQNDAEATYAAKITREDCALDFSRSAAELSAQIRGLSPIPLAFTHLPDGKLLKVVSAHVTGGRGEAGEILACDDRGDGEIVVACGEGAIALTAVVPEGKGRMSAGDLVRGRRVAVGERLR